MLKINIEGIIDVDLYVFGKKELLDRISYECCDIDYFIDFKKINLISKYLQEDFYILHYN